MRNLNWLLPIFIFIGSISLVSAQTGGSYEITQSVIASGGGEQSAGGNFAVIGTIGQSLAGTNPSGGAYNLRGGFWAFPTLAPPSAPVSISGRVFSGKGLGIVRRVSIVLLDTTTGIERTTQTNERGFYRFGELEINRFYVVRAASRNFTFSPDSHFISLTEDREDVNFTGARQLQN
jgi:hypothetical protein